MAIYKRDIVDINLETGNIHRSFLKHSIGYLDQAADHFGIRVLRNGEPVDLTGVTVQGIFMPPQGNPIAITTGNIIEENVAEVVLPQACYNYDGQFCLSIKLVDATNAITGTMRIVDGMVDNTHASGTVAPTETVPTYQEILSVYADMVTALVTVDELDDEVSDLKSAITSVIDFESIPIDPVFTLGKNISSAGAFQTHAKRIATAPFIDVSSARKTSTDPVSDNEYVPSVTYSLQNNYWIYVAYYNTPSESATDIHTQGWLTGTGTLTPTGNYMRIGMKKVVSDTEEVMTVAEASNLTLTINYKEKTIVDKINKWGLVLKGYANTTSFDNNVSVGIYIIRNSTHGSISDGSNPIVGSDGALLVIPATNYSSESPKLITGLIQIAVSNNGEKVYFRRVSGANTRTFGTWKKILWKDLENLKTRINADADPGFTADSFEEGGISESGGNVTNSKRIRTKGYVSLEIHNCIRYDIQSGYRAYIVPFTGQGASYNKPGTGWLQGSGILRWPDDIHYYRFALASINDETSLTTSDYNKITISLDYKLNDTFIDIVKKTKWLALGDSITYGVYSTGAGVEVKASNGWVNQLAGSLGYELKNMGEPGIGFCTISEDTHSGKVWGDVLDDVDELTDEYNMVTVALGINDYNKSTITLSDISSVVDSTIQRLMTKFPSSRLVFITPFNSNRRGDASTNYCYNYEHGGRSLKDIADLIQSRCANVGVECIYASNGFLLNNYNMGTLLPDSTHPSTYCHMLIAKNMAHFLLN